MTVDDGSEFVSDTRLEVGARVLGPACIFEGISDVSAA